MAATLPPGPSLPRFAQTLGFIFAPVKFMQAMRRRYGDVVTFGTSFDPQFVMVFDPALLKQVMQGPAEQLRAGEANALLEPIVGSRSVLLLDGSEHMRQRKLMLPPFHGRRLGTYEELMRESVDREIGTWPVGEEFDLMTPMRSLTLDIIMGAILGVGEGARREQLKDAIRATIAPVGQSTLTLVFVFLADRFGIKGPVQKVEQRREALDRLIYAEIERRRGEPDLDERDDVFSLLLQATDEHGEPLSDKELRDELVTLLVAGHETTATGLAWTFDLLLHNPRVMARLKESLAAGETEYADAVVKEALRIRPVIPGFGRKVRGAPFRLGSYEIPDGVEINPSIAVMHGRADSYPDPASFRPERFLEEDAPDTYTWIPFGGGVRRCLGASFAQMEMRITLERVLARCELRPARSKPERPRRRGITVVPEHDAPVVMTRAPVPE